MFCLALTLETTSSWVSTQQTRDEETKIDCQDCSAAQIPTHQIDIQYMYILLVVSMLEKNLIFF
jgi:hypothetical protein